VDAIFLNSVQTPKDLVFRHELEMLASRHRTFQSVVSTTSRSAIPGWQGLTGRIDRVMLEQVAPDLAERQIYLCGPEGFMQTARSVLGELGFDMARLHSESFATSRSKSDETTDAEGAQPANDVTEQVTLEFARSGKRISGNKRLTLLELAEAHGVELEYGCRTGNCGDCKVRLLHGEAVSDDFALSPTERSAGWVLSCVAKAQTDCVLDA
jgi:ferredoxin-NADP reductase